MVPPLPPEAVIVVLAQKVPEPLAVVAAGKVFTVKIFTLEVPPPGLGL